MREEWVIRPARPDDLADARRLLLDSQLPAEGLEPDFATSYAVADWAGQVVGVAGIERHGRVGLLRSVAVADDRLCEPASRSPETTATEDA